MAEPRWNDMTDERMESMLKDMLPELPPDDVSAATNPWSSTMLKLIWGLGLTSITIHFFKLELILPAVGWVLILLAFRTIRGENGWFRACWLLSAVRVAATVFTFVLNGTIWNQTVCETAAFRVVNGGLLLLQLVTDVLLWCGLRTVRRKAGLSPGAWSAGALLLWHFLVFVIAVNQMNFTAAGLVLLAVYGAILASLRRLFHTLDQAGYGLEASPLNISNGVLAIVLAAVTVVGGGAGFLLFHSYPMDWRPVTVEVRPEIASVKEHLAALGFPQDVLEDLSDEDVLALKGAKRVVTGTGLYPVNEGRWEETSPKSFETVYDVEELRISGVAVELDGERERWQLIHHFRWEVNPGFWGTESIQLWPAWRLGEGWKQAGDLTGRLLCVGDNVTYEAPYYSVEEKTYGQTDLFDDSQTKTDIFAVFSLPRKSEQQRGYICYPVEEVNDGWIIDGWINYTHQASPWQYPNLTAMDMRMRDSWTVAGVFRTVQTAIQLDPHQESDELLGYETK